ncbi:hypothetical protein YTPLAS18_28850 [Nitrospira sp.]|nr:hypothetical protein YTPLAS18_28850 [Nitrospira sp.]
MLRRSYRTAGIWRGILLLTALGVPPCLPTPAAVAEEPAGAPSPVHGPPSPFDAAPPEQPSGSVVDRVIHAARTWQQDKLVWETGAGRSYLLPAGEILLYEFLLNLFDRNFVEPQEAYRTNWNTIWKNLTDSKWVIDDDQFKVNQFLHPYGGSIYYGLARSTGLNFWESFLYSVGGSFVWEIAGETTNPSINDMIATPIGGTFLGEPFFRMANLVLEDSNGKPGFWRELGAAVISPPTGFNRFVFGNKFDAVYPSHQPATFLRLEVGGSISSSSRNVSSNVEENGAVGDFTFTHGLPGKPGYTYARPFDFFDFHLTAVTANVLESINSYGLLVGTTYASGKTTRGIWGLYGSYDYISPQVFRVSSTALALGTTWQTWLSHTVALQGTALAGTGYGAAGRIQQTGERDYHYGLTPQGMLNLRLMVGDRVMWDVTGRDYYVSDVLSPEQGGWEHIARVESSLTWRVVGRHGVALRYWYSHRNAQYPGVDYRDQAIGTVSVMYVLLGDSAFGAVEWR